MISQSTAKERITLGLDRDIKLEVDAEAKELGFKTAEYLRRILRDREKILNAPDANPAEREELEKLHLENQRLRQMVEGELASRIDEKTEEINSLVSENDALRADMELLRTESENSIDREGIAEMEENLKTANSIIEEESHRVSDLKKAHELEKQALIDEHEKVRIKLMDELNVQTSAASTDAEAELVAQHKEEINAILEKYKREQYESALKSILIEELDAEIDAHSDSETNQTEVEEAQNVALKDFANQVSELENELADVKSQLSTERQIVLDTSRELDDKRNDYRALYDEFKENEEQLKRLITESEKFHYQHEELRKENQQIASEVYSHTQTIERLEASLREAEIKYKQLHHEKSVAEREKTSVIANLESLQEAVNADKHNLLLLQENALKQTEEAKMLYQNQMQETAAYQNKCAKKQAQIEGLERLTQKLQEEIDLLNDQLEMIGEEVSEEKIGYVEPVFESKYPQPTATKFNENENELYSEYIICLSEKHPEEEVEKLILASLDNACRNENAVWVSVPFSKSLKSINKKI